MRKFFVDCFISQLESFYNMCQFKKSIVEDVEIRGDARQYATASLPSKKFVFYKNNLMTHQKKLGRGTDGWVDEYVSEDGERVAIKAFTQNSAQSAIHHMQLAKKLKPIQEFIIPCKFLVTKIGNPFHIMEVADGTIEHLFFKYHKKNMDEEKKSEAKRILSQFEDWVIELAKKLMRYDICISDFKLGNVVYKTLPNNKIKFYLIDIDSISPAGEIELVATHSIGSYIGYNERSQRTATIQSIALTMLLITAILSDHTFSDDFKTLIYYNPEEELCDTNAKKKFQALQKKRRDCRIFRDVQFYPWKYNWYCIMSFQIYSDYNFFHTIDVFKKNDNRSIYTKKLEDRLIEQPPAKKPKYIIV